MRTTDRFNVTLGYAERIHRMQVRKGSEGNDNGPTAYLSHLMSVSALVMEYGGDEDQAIAALLHDAVEDQGGKPRLADIREQFGERVAHIVEACTDTDVVPKPPWKERKVAYINGLKSHGPDSLLVSCADKLHNARSILADYRVVGEAIWERFKAGRDGSLWYYRALADEFARLGVGPVADELGRTVAAIEVLATDKAPEKDTAQP